MKKDHRGVLAMIVGGIWFFGGLIGDDSAYKAAGAVMVLMGLLHPSVRF